ncbi:MAG TPA: guanylate kinase [Elusimicrobiota bacterium]|nr:guanylate kinase [Elusimicrobiota bacterium]
MSTGLLLVVSGPSGAGKSTLCQALIAKWPNLRYSVSCTTRPRREKEVDGRDYHFVSEDAFQKNIRDGKFLEWARVHDSFYGTLQEPLMEHLRQGLDVVLDVDPHGALSIKEKFADCVGVYICPPTWESLEDRLRSRAQDDELSISKRLANARKEMGYLSHYDYLVVNKVFRESLENLSAILRAEHSRVKRLSHELTYLEIMEEEKA